MGELLRREKLGGLPTYAGCIGAPILAFAGESSGTEQMTRRGSRVFSAC